MELDKSLLSKIKKLLKLQESATQIGNLEEAGNAAMRVQEMLLKYNLDISVVNLHDTDEKPEQPVEKHQFNTLDLTKPHEGAWVPKLLQVIARHNLCYLLGYSGDSYRVAIIGTASNVEVVWFLVEQLVNRIRPMAKEAFRTYQGHEKRNTFVRGFLQGASRGIDDQLTEAKNKRKEDAEVASSISADLRIESANTAIAIVNMVQKEEDRVREYIQTKMNVSRGGKGPSYKGASGKQMGYATGKSMSIHGGVTGGSGSGPKRLN